MRQIPAFAASCAVLVLLLVLPSGPGSAADWPSFRGGDAAGSSVETDIPERWSATENVAWRVDVPGRSWSSPIVWGKKVFLTTAVNSGKDHDPKKGLYFGGERRDPIPHEHRWLVLCLDLDTGRTLWEREAASGKPPKGIHIKNTYASETPATDGERVYAYFGNAGLFCYDLDGTKLWERRSDPVATRYSWGTASSPAVHDGSVYIVNDNDSGSFIAAIDARTGAERWRLPREEKSNWSSPFVWRHEQRTEIVTAGSGKVRSYGLDGSVLWEFSGMSTICIATPYARHGLVYISSGYVGDALRPIYAVRPGAKGDISLADGQSANESIAWCDRRAAPYNPTTLVHGDLLYVLFDGGFLSCHDARSGKVVYPKQRLATGIAFTASPWACGERVFCLSEDGDTYVIRAGPEHEHLHTNSLGEMCMATPALASGTLLVRTITKLYAIRDASKTR